MKLKHWFALIIIGALTAALWTLTSRPPTEGARSATTRPTSSEGADAWPREVTASTLPDVRLRAAPPSAPLPLAPRRAAPSVAPAPSVELVHAPLEPTPPLDALPVEEEEDSGAPRMVWSTDVEGIRGAMRESIPEIKACYEAWVKAYPEMEGRLIASFTISADPEEDRGLVSEVAILDSELKHKMMEGCVLDVVSELRFVAPSGGPLTVRYPFNFAVPAEP